MGNYFKRMIRNFDYPLFITYIGLCLFGLVMIYSASMVWAASYLHYSSDYFYNKQLTNLAVAVPVFFLSSFFPFQNYKRKKLMIFSVVFMFVMLILVHVLGTDVYGAKSWIRVPGFGSLQPSEIAKIVIIIYFSSVFAKKYEAGNIDSINKAIGPPVLILVFAIGLIMMETDIGTSFIIIATSLAVIAASGIRFKTFFKLSGILSLAVLAAIAILYIGWDSIMTDGRQGRILSFLNPFDYALGSGYQIANGYIAIGSGGVQGLGLGNSIQKMGYLPEPQTDVILAVISEEIGIFGTIIVLGGLGFIVMRALYIAMNTKDPQARMLAAGVGSVIGIQTFVNVGGLTGLIPLTGVTLPFISYGGTSLILLSLALGILMNVSMFTKYQRNK